MALDVAAPAVLKNPWYIVGEVPESACGPAAERAAVPGSPGSTSKLSDSRMPIVLTPVTVAFPAMVIWLAPMDRASVVGLVTVSVVGLDSATGVVEVIASVVGEAMIGSAVVMVAVAGADIVTVEPRIDAMVAPLGIPVPLSVCPTANPLMLEAEVMLAEPDVVMPVNAVALVAVATADMVTAVVDGQVTFSAVVMVAVAFADIVTVAALALMAVMVVPLGIPVPVTDCPTDRPMKLDTVVRTLLPEVVKAVKMTLPTEEMVVLNAMPAPVRRAPATSPERLDTPVMTVLPEVVTPVKVAVTGVLALAFPDIVTSPVPTAAMVVPAGMPVPVIG